MMRGDPYRAVAESAEPPFESEAHALTALDEDDEPAPQDFGVSSVLMRAEDFTHQDRSQQQASLTVIAVAFAALLTLCALIAWIAERVL